MEVARKGMEVDKARREQGEGREGVKPDVKPDLEEKQSDREEAVAVVDVGAARPWRASKWAVPVAASIVHALHAACVYIGPSTLLSPMRKDLGLTVSEISLPLNIYRVINAIFLAPVGVFLDKYGAEAPMRASILSAALLSFLLPLCWTLPQLIVLQSLFAISKLFGGLTSMLMLTSSWFPDNEGVGAATSILLGGYSAAGFFAPLILGFFGQNYGWRVACFFLAVLFAVIGLPLTFVLLRDRSTAKSGAVRASRAPSGYDQLKDGQVQAPPVPTTTPGGSAAISTQPPTLPSADAAALFSPPYAAVMGIVASFTVSMHIILDHLIIFLTEEIGFSLETASLYMSSLNLVALGTKILAGFLADRTGKGVLMVFFGVLSFLGSLIIFAPEADTSGRLALSTSPLQLALFVPIYAAGYAGVFNLVTAVLPEFGQERLGLRSNLNLMVLFGFGSLGSYAAGVLRTSSGTYFWSFVLNSASCLFVIFFGALYAILSRQSTIKMSNTAVAVPQRRLQEAHLK